jgi:hypothetical protein
MTQAPSGHTKISGSLGPLFFLLISIISISLSLAGCGVLNLGEWKGIETSDPDEKYYLVKDAFLTASSAAMRRDDFDHTLQPVINLVFIPANEPGHYVTKSIWYAPDGSEFDVIRQTHDRRQEANAGEQRKKEGTTRIHTISTQDLWEKGEGLWKVELYIDDELAKRIEFTVQ